MDDHEPDAPQPDRRSLLSGAAVTAGLLASYGTAGLYALCYLYPARELERRWLFVCAVSRLAPGESLEWRSPGGEAIAIARQSAGETAADFRALSSVCPHLGCQVHWQAGPKRFFCPCHNGAFDAEGVATDGPPADAGQDLSRYPLLVEDGLLFIEVAVEGLAAAEAERSARGGA